MIKEDATGVIESDSYELVGKVGQGTWGTVYKAKDSTFDKEHPRIVAIKVCTPTVEALDEMRRMKLDPMKVMRKEAEAGELKPGMYVVPRKFALDKNRRPFIVMPFYDHTLANIIGNDDEKRMSVTNGLSKEVGVKIIRDLTTGLSEIHGEYGVAHGDLKPKNAMIWTRTPSSHNFSDPRNFKALWTDFGDSSQCLTMSPRDGRGFRYTRAPECFRTEGKDGCNPDKKSDVWGMGSMILRVLNGRYALEELISRNPGNYSDVIQRLYDKSYTGEGDNIVWKEIKKVPQVWRPVLEHSLLFNPYSRYPDGVHMLEDVEKAVDNLSGYRVMKEQIMKGLRYFALPTALVSAAIVAAYKHEPTELTMPKVNISGPLTLTPDKNPITFSRENIPVSAEDREPEGGMIDGLEKFAKRSTDNRVAAFLANKYMKARWKYGSAFSGIPDVTDHQMRIYAADRSSGGEGIGFNAPYPSVSWLATAKSIEWALTQSVNPDGTVDLEDTLVKARLGGDVLDKARKASGSFDYAVYRTAKGPDGKYVIPETEQKFLNTWLGYINSEGVDFKKK